MNELQLIEWLSTKCYFKIRNSFSGMFMAPELVVYYMEAETRLKHKTTKFESRSKVTLLPALQVMKIQIETWYKENAPEYLEE